MANPQTDEGHLKIAYSLLEALYQADLTGLQMRIILVIMNLTYSAGVTKSVMTLTDIRYQMGFDVRPNRVEKAFNGLLEANIVKADGKTIGIQKDFDKWKFYVVPASSGHNVRTSINIYNIYPNTRADKMSVPTVLLDYTQEHSHNKLSSIKQKGVEERNARQLYTKAVAYTHSPHDALLLVKDYLDYTLANDWVQVHVTMKLTFALSKFDAWLKKIPLKPRRIKEQEAVTGYRFRYNVDNKQWEVADAKSNLAIH